MVIFFVLIIVWCSLSGAIVLLIPFFRSYGFGVFLFSYAILAIIGMIPLFYVWNRFFKDAVSSLGTKIFRTCTFQGLGVKRQAYLDQLTCELTEIDFEPINRSSLDWMESFGFEGTDLVFKSPNKWNVGIRTLSVKEDLKVGLVSRGTLRQLLLEYSAGVILAMTLFVMSAFGLKAVGLDPNTSAVIAMFISLTVMFLMALLITLQKRTVNRKVMKVLVETAKSMGSNQMTPFKKTTVELED
jgi:hypothetical protein